MSLSTWMLKLVTHPMELYTELRYHIYRKQQRDITARTEHATSGWDRSSMRRCWEFLDQTSRSFSAVIKQLDGDLARTICLFYLVLRALDTIEDDMTLAPALKQSLLRNFHTHSTTPGWAFTGSGHDEKDRQLLVEYALVIEEFALLPHAYRAAILDIAHKSGVGMADFAARADQQGGNEDALVAIGSIAEFDLYCHYVAGLVGEGLALLFAASGEEPTLLAPASLLGAQSESPYRLAPGIAELSNSLGLFLQKTNITRDVREDVDERRFFWPREIWGATRYGGGFGGVEEMCLAGVSNAAGEGADEKSLWTGTPCAAYVQSAMVVEALRHATGALDFMDLLKNRSVWKLCAIPSALAIATLNLCFMNPRAFQENVKIRKAEAASLIMRSTNTREVSYISRDYARKIHARALPQDPNFSRISVACGKIEKWCEHHYPSFRISPVTSCGTEDIRPHPHAQTAGCGEEM